MERGGGSTSSFHKWKIVQRGSSDSPPPVGPREQIQDVFLVWAIWELVLAWLRFRWSWPGLMHTFAVSRSRLCLWMGKCPPNGNCEMGKEGGKTTQTQSAHKLTGQAYMLLKTQCSEPHRTRMSCRSPAQAAMLHPLLCAGDFQPSIPWLGHTPLWPRKLDDIWLICNHLFAGMIMHIII